MKPKSTKKRGKPDPAILADIVKRIVEVANPEKIDCRRTIRVNG